MQEHHRSISASTSRSSLLFALCTFAAGCTDQSVLSGNFEQLPRRFVEPGIMDIPGAPADDQIRVAWRPNGEPYPPIVMGGAGPLQRKPSAKDVVTAGFCAC